MVGILSSFVVAGLLTAGPSGVNFDGPRVTARTTGSTGFFTQGALPFTDLFERGSGSVDFSVQERVADPRATYGDVGRLDATFTLGATVYRVELTQVGFPPAAAQQRHESGPLPPPPGQPISGGVVVDQELHGGAMLGAPNMTREHAAAALWGVGRLWRNGQLVSDTALIHAAALDRGAHADDDTFRVLPVARPGDSELDVLVWNLPQSIEPRGFIQFDFDDVAIDWNGVPVPAVAVVPNAGVFYGLAPASSPVVGGAALGSVALSTSNPLTQGTGGSGLTNASRAVTDGLSDPTRTQQLAPYADITLPAVANQVGNNAVPQNFRNEGRVALSVPTTNQSLGIIGTDAQSVPAIPDPFLTADRVRTANATTSTNATANGTTTGTTSTSQSTLLSSNGSYAVLPQVSGPGFAFGGTWIAPGIITTPSPGGVQPPVPLVSSPQPLNGLAAVPLIAAPQPLGVSNASPLVQSIQPLGVQSSSAAPPTAPVPLVSPGAPSVPGLVSSPAPARMR